MGLAQKLFGTHSEHELKRIYPIADKIEGYRESYSKLSDEELKGKTKEFKDRLAKGETLDDILPEAFATVRGSGQESSWYGTLSCSAYRRNYSSSGKNCRDEDW